MKTLIDQATKERKLIGFNTLTGIVFYFPDDPELLTDGVENKEKLRLLNVYDVVNFLSTELSNHNKIIEDKIVFFSKFMNKAEEYLSIDYGIQEDLFDLQNTIKKM